MDHKSLFDKVSIRTSRLTTRLYSTSFSLGIRCLDRHLRDPIYSVYGFVRFADEIVDTFHDYNKKSLLQRFSTETWNAIEERISLNPILNAFQATVHQFKIGRGLIEQFLSSMEMDLTEKEYGQQKFEEYVLGSAEVVGLMCLHVFCQGDSKRYTALKPYAMRLGAAFQKINFLRDLRADYKALGRTYFPGIDMATFDENDKKQIEDSIAADLHEGFIGIKKLPRSSRLGVYVAYLYYRTLYHKIRRLPCHRVMTSRIRVRKRYKLALLGYSYVRHTLNMI